VAPARRTRMPARGRLAYPSRGEALPRPPAPNGAAKRHGALAARHAQRRAKTTLARLRIATAIPTTTMLVTIAETAVSPLTKGAAAIQRPIGTLASPTQRSPGESASSAMANMTIQPPKKVALSRVTS